MRIDVHKNPGGGAYPEYVLLVQELAAIPASALGALVGSLQARRDDIVAALDLLCTGL